MTIHPKLPTCLVATAVALSNHRAVVAAALTSLEEDLDKHSRNGRLSYLFGLQNKLLAEVRDYRRGSLAAVETAAEDSPTEVSDLRRGRDASTEHERFLRKKYPELADEKHDIRLSMRVNLVLIGFQGEDDDLLNVPHETLELWLEHLPSVVRHATTAPGSYPAREREKETAPVDVEYVYRYHVVDVARKVRDALEAHMRAYLREDPLEDGSPPPRPAEGDDGSPPSGSDGGGGERSNRTTKGRMFMPSWRMEEFLGSLAIELETEAWKDGEGEDARPAAYTFFVLNPRRAWISSGGDSRGVSAENGPTYGYRCALSPAVMESLAADPEVVRWAEEMKRSEQLRWRVVHEVDQTASGMDDFIFEDEFFDSPPGRSRQDSTRGVIERTDRTDISYRWAAERLTSLPVDGGSNSPRAWDVSEEKALLLRGDSGVTSPPEGRARILLRDVLEKHRRKGDSGGASGGSPSTTGSACLTESWVSGERFAWVDLQAGPFEWGPASGGEGFKSASSSGLLRWDRVSPMPPVFQEERRVGADGVAEEERGDDPRSRVLELRGRLSTRIDRLAALGENMACGDKLMSDDRREKTAGGRSGGRRLGAGAVGVTCEEINAQLELLHGFQEKESQVTTAADDAAAKAEAAVAADGSVLEGEEDAGDDVEGFADTLRALRRTHVALLEEVLGELSPATESDSRGATWKASRSRSPESASPGLRIESQALLARLAALVSSLARTVITPPSALPLPLPPSPRSNSNNIGQTTTAALGGEQGTRLQVEDHGGEGGEGWCPGCRLDHHRAPPPYHFPTGPALTLRARHGGLDKTSVASASGHASSGHPLLSPPRPPLALEFFVPEDLAFTLYVVRAQGVYPPLGTPPATPSPKVDDRKYNRVGEMKEGKKVRQPGRPDGGAVERSSGFDLPAFQAGAMSLKLPNQRASFTVHQVAASTDPTLASALAGATGESMVNVVTPRGEPRVERRVSIDSAKIRHQLRAKVEDEDTEVAATAAEQARRHTRHITIFLFSLAGPDSVYVDELWRARAVGGDVVVIAQSEQRRDHAPPLVCGGRAVEEDPRNPLRQALAALGSTVGGLVPSQHSWHEARGGGVVVDWRWSMSESPMSPVVPHAQFSQLDQDVIYRTHVVRALSASAELTRAGSTVLLNALSRETYRNILEGPLSDSLEETRASLREVSDARADVIRKMDTMAFDLVVRKLNPLLDMSRRCYEDALRLDLEVIVASRRLAGLDGTTAGAFGSAFPLPSSDLTRLLLGLLIVLSILAAWFLRRASNSSVLFRRSRHPKRVKIN